MKLVYHGGRCCGIKTIHALGENPKSLQCEDNYVCTVANADSNWMVTKCEDSFYHGLRPQETAEARLKAFVEFVSMKRPSHVVEVAIVTQYRPGNYPEANQTFYNNNYGQAKWVPVLTEMGFKPVTKFLNSNSNNEVTIFHLTLFKGKVVEWKED